MRKRVAALLAAVILTAASAVATEQGSVTPPEHRRPPDQTFLTYPEWFLVFSPAEYAAFLARGGQPSDFPFFGHIRQFWQGYAGVIRNTREFPFNGGYHVMILVIGTSTTAEYAVRSGYEVLVGRLAELTRRGPPTAEEMYGAQVAQEYVDFIRARPWYDFDFFARLRHLLAIPMTGRDQVRKWERKYALTSEYAAKGLYGWIIRKATKASYDEPLPVTAMVLDRLPPGVEKLPELKLIRSWPDGSALVTVPRYEAFMGSAMALARSGAGFREIAGNRGAIVVSVLVPSGQLPPGNGTEMLLAQPILTTPGRQRMLLKLPVNGLSAFLRSIQPPVSLEHIYDY